MPLTCNCTWHLTLTSAVTTDATATATVISTVASSGAFPHLYPSVEPTSSAVPGELRAYVILVPVYHLKVKLDFVGSSENLKINF